MLEKVNVRDIEEQPLESEKINCKSTKCETAKIIIIVILSHRKVTTSATLANITQAESMTEVAVVIYARNIRIGKARIRNENNNRSM